MAQDTQQKTEEEEEKEAVAKLRRVRITPKKARKIADMIRDENLEEAEVQLLMSPRRASSHILKLVKSAVANATHNHNMDANKLYIKEIRVDEGPTYKRWMPRAFGRATPIHKKTSHIHVTLSESDKRESQPQYVIPESSSSSDEDEGGQTQQPDKDQPHQPTEAQKPTEGRSGGGLRGMFRRKSGM